MNRRIQESKIIHMRNNIPIKETLHALQLPWKWEDELLRFKCPLCGGMHTSLHPTENLARCFDCSKNFNPIDLVMMRKKCGFRVAITWLNTFEKVREQDDFREMLIQLMTVSRLKL